MDDYTRREIEHIRRANDELVRLHRQAAVDRYGSWSDEALGDSGCGMVFAVAMLAAALVGGVALARLAGGFWRLVLWAGVLYVGARLLAVGATLLLARRHHRRHLPRRRAPPPPQPPYEPPTGG